MVSEQDQASTVMAETTESAEQPRENTTLLLQPFVPYPQALRWEIQSNYYSDKGLDAWLNKEVPTTITTNSFAALTNATLVLEAAVEQSEMGALGASDPVVVIEYGAGLGLFAYNFIRRFEQLCRREGKDFAQRLIYIASDYSPEVAQALCQQAFLQKFIQSGHLKVASADVTADAPITYYTPDANAPAGFTSQTEALPALSAIITNYVHCCLPTDLLKQTGTTWHTKLVETSLELSAEEVASGASAERVLQSDKILDRLIEKERWDEIALKQFCIDEAHFQALQTVCAGRVNSHLLNPIGSFNSIKALEPKLRDGGIYLIHDKGHIETRVYDVDATTGRSTHGGSTAFMTNFPLIRAYAQARGFQCYLTRSYQNLIQTLLIEKSSKPSHQKTFRYLFGDFNTNSDLLDLHVYAQELAEAGQTKTAIGALQKCLRYRSLDAELHYFQGCLYLKSGLYQRALNCVQKGRPLDHYGQYNFTMMEAEAHFKLENYTLSLRLFCDALEKIDNTADMKKIEKLMFEAHAKLGLETEAFTPDRYPALARIPADQELA